MRKKRKNLNIPLPRLLSDSIAELARAFRFDFSPARLCEFSSCSLSESKQKTSTRDRREMMMTTTPLWGGKEKIYKLKKIIIRISEEKKSFFVRFHIALSGRETSRKSSHHVSMLCVRLWRDLLHVSRRPTTHCHSLDFLKY